MSDIFSGKGLTLQYNTDIGNRSPQGIGNSTISELNTFPNLTIQSEVNTFDTYNSGYSAKLLSDQTIQPFDISVNYLPDDSSHMFLDSMAESGTKFQVTAQYKLENTEQEIVYSIVNGYITSTSTSGDKDSVLTKSYTFTPEDVIARVQAADALLPIYQGDYGVGSNTTDVPQYQPTVPTGNSFIKVPSTQAGNPAGADMMGVGLVDGTSIAEFAMTKTGTLSLYAKNATTAWTRIYTATQMDARYVPLTRTINGHALSIDVVLNSNDTGSLAIANNLSDVADAQAARESLDMYSKSETDASLSEMQGNLNIAINELTESTDTRFSDAYDELNALAMDVSITYVPKTNTVNGHALSSNVVLTKADVGLSNVTNDAQLKIASNLGDLGNVATARGNLALDRFVQEQTLSYMQSSSTTANRLFVSNTGSWGVLDNAGNPIPLPIIYGGTAANSVSGARTNLGLGTAAVQNIGTSGATIPLLNSSNTWTGVQIVQSNGLRTPTTAGGSYASLSGESDYAMLWRMNTSTKANEFIGIRSDSQALFRQATNDTGGYADRLIYHSGNLPSVFEQGGMPRINLTTQDLNTIDGTLPGFYTQSSSGYATTINNYPTTNAGSLVVIQNPANNVAGCNQLYYPFNSNDIWIRRKEYGSPTVSVWTTWVRMYTDDISATRYSLGLGVTDAVQFSNVNTSGTINATTSNTVKANSANANCHFWLYGATGNSRGVLYGNAAGVMNLRVDNDNANTTGYGYTFTGGGHKLQINEQNQM